MSKHYFNMSINSINRDRIKKIEWEKSKTLFKNKNKIPEWDNIKIFEWVFSQNFKKWEKSRNWYKYDQNGWVVENYERLPIILWQHDDSYGWIWFTQELYIDTKWNLAWIFYVDTNTLEERHARQVNWWYVKWISTWAITLESMFEDNETWKRYTRADAEEKFGWENVIKSLWWVRDSVLTYVVTKAELLENSLVTIWSNFGAIAKSVNTLDDEMKSIAKQMQSEHDKNLFTKNSTMNPEELKNALETSQDEVKELKNEVSTKNTEIDTLKDDIKEKDDNITKLEDDLSKKEDENKELQDNLKKANDEVDKMRDKEKDKVKKLANVKVNNKEKKKGDEEDKMENASDFEKKYS